MFSRRMIYTVASLVSFLMLPVCALRASASLSLVIDRTSTPKAISPDLFGIFFEDLNYAADGGLYAEMIQNRSFEYSSTEQKEWNEWTAWTTASRDGATGGVGVRSAKPLHPNNPHYLSIEAKDPKGGFGVSNQGFGGIPLVGGEAYHLSLFTHQLFMGEPWTLESDVVNRPMPISIRLEDEKGELLAQKDLVVVGRNWVRLEATLMPSRSELNARVVILLGAKGGIAIDEVSLFPEKTFRGRKNGLRADLAQVIADLKPKFVRFPGGCLAHGDGLSNIYQWKDTIGPIEQRRGQRNLWGYHQSMGLGYFEYFQFCEDIGAKPLPVVAAGVTCQNSNFSPWHGQQCVPMENMGAYIQDILDLVEWANGPITSEWGARRAAAGHPAPFDLKYLGVGNEDVITPEFEERFRMIREAVNQRYPDIVVIGTSGAMPDGPDFDRGWAFARAEKVAMVDEHFYRSPDWFWANLNRYDGYDRKGPKVYVGEYAVHEADRRNTLRSAIAEVAGYLSFERNGEVVHFASYAPLLARRGHTQWTPDLIYFTGTDVYPSINYYAQRLLGENSGDLLISSRADGVSPDFRFAHTVVQDSQSGDLIVKMVNGEATPMTVAIQMRSASAAAQKLVTTVLTGANPDIVNEDGQPSAALPVMEEKTVGSHFEQVLPPHSFCVLRLR